MAVDDRVAEIQILDDTLEGTVLVAGARHSSSECRFAPLAAFRAFSCHAVRSVVGTHFMRSS